MTMISITRVMPNPYRDFTLHPYDQVQIKKLKASIGSDGFWASLVARETRAGYEIAFGHHRVEAARLVGMTEIPVEVRDLTDWQMVRMLASENATQRGSTAAASLDAVAAISKVVAYTLLRWDEAIVVKNFTSIGCFDYRICRGLLEAGSGVGRNCIEAFAPHGAFTASQINSALAMLKQSGRMAKIVADARLLADAGLEMERVEAETLLELAKRREEHARNKQERVAAMDARKTAEDEANKKREAVEAASKAAEATVQQQPVVYDAECAQLFRLESHAEEFRKVVTGETFQSYLPVSGQFEFAKEVIKRATEHSPRGHMMTAADIRGQCWSLIETGLGMGRAKMRTAPERPYLEEIRDGLNFIRRSEADCQRGVALLLNATRKGETLSVEQQSLLEELTSKLTAVLTILQPLHTRQPLKVIGGKDLS